MLQFLLAAKIVAEEVFPFSETMEWLKNTYGLQFVQQGQFSLGKVIVHHYIFSFSASIFLEHICLDLQIVFIKRSLWIEVALSFEPQ